MKAKFHNIPSSSGVYLLLNWDNEIIYVGSTEQKGGVRRRLQQHLGPSNGTLQFDPFEVKAVLHHRSDDVRMLEKKIISCLARAGEPLRNVRKNFGDVIPADRDCLSRFRTIDLWDEDQRAPVRAAAARRLRIRENFQREWAAGVSPDA